MQKISLYVFYRIVFERLFNYGVDPFRWEEEATNQGIKISLLK